MAKKPYTQADIDAVTAEIEQLEVHIRELQEKRRVMSFANREIERQNKIDSASKWSETKHKTLQALAVEGESIHQGSYSGTSFRKSSMKITSATLDSLFAAGLISREGGYSSGHFVINQAGRDKLAEWNLFMVHLKASDGNC